MGSHTMMGDKDMDDEAWLDLFIQLTGGTNEGLNQNRSRTNLSQDDEIDETDTSINKNLLKTKRKSMQEKPSTSPSLKTKTTPRLSLPRLDTPRLSITPKDPLLDAMHRSIELDKLEKYILGKKSVELEIEFGIARKQLCRAVSKLKKEDKDHNGRIEYQEWVTFYHKHIKDASALFPAFQVLLYQPQYSCRPPAVIILMFSLIQVACYIWHSTVISGIVSDPLLSNQAPVCSVLIYNPTKRHEAWRFLTYQFVHVNMEHIVFNTLMQLVVGLPLEMSQPGALGTLKVVIVYLAGVIFGSVGGSLPNPTSYLAGASAGVYALIAAHVSTLVMNWNEDGAVYKGRNKKSKSVSRSLDPLIRAARLAFVITFTMFDVSYAIYNYYSGVKTNTGYMGHLCGAVAGLLVGIVMLENRKVETWEVKLKIVSICVYLLLLLSTILWHLFGTDTGYFPATSHVSSCHYVVDGNYSTANITSDHTHF